jgi:hypothetical protein
MKRCDKIILSTLGALVLGLGVAGAVVANQPAQQVGATSGTAVYTVSSTSTVTVSGTPTGTASSYSSTYSTKEQLTKGNSMTLRLTSWSGFKITSIVLNAHSNASAGAGSFAYSLDGSTYTNLISGNFNSAWSTAYTASYVDVTVGNIPGAGIQPTDTDIWLKAAATTNSLYIHSFSIGWENVSTKTVSSLAASGTLTNASYSSDGTFDPSGLTITATYSDNSAETVTSLVTWPSLTAGMTSIVGTYGGQSVTINGLTVTAAPSYSLVTSADALSYGADVIIADSTNSVAAGAFDSTNERFLTQAVTIASDAIATSKSAVFTLGYSGAYYTFLNGSSYLASASTTTGKAALISPLADEGKWAVAIASNVVTMTAQGQYTNNIFGHNSVSTAYFGCYSTLKGSMALYQKANYTLTSLAVSGSLTKASYYDNEAFDPSGLTATATFTKISDNSTLDVDVTSRVSWPTSHLAAGTTSVNGTFVSGGVTKTIASPAISVAAVSLTSIAVTTQPSKLSYATGAAFDTTGLVVTGTYNNASTAEVTDYTIDPANGATLNTAGTITVTVSHAGVASVTFAIEVHIAKKFVKVTNVKQLIYGAKIYIGATNASSNLYLLSSTQNGNNRAQIAASLSGSDVLEDESAGLITLGAPSTGSANFSMSTAAGYLYAASSSSNYLRSETTLDAQGDWAITVSNEGVASIVAQGSNTHNVIMHNNGSSLFSCYLPTQTGMDTISIYEQESYVTAADHAKTCYETLGSACLGATSPATASGDLKAAWNLIYGDYVALASDVKSILTSASAKIDGGYAEELAARYDYIIQKYGTSAFPEGNFMNRSTSGASSVLGLQGNESGAIIMIASVGVLGLLTTAGVFILKKKHI